MQSGREDTLEQRFLNRGPRTPKGSVEKFYGVREDRIEMFYTAVLFNGTYCTSKGVPKFLKGVPLQ